MSKKIWTAVDMGRKGGLKSRRTLTAEQARAMVSARVARRKAKLAGVKYIPVKINVLQGKNITKEISCLS